MKNQQKKRRAKTPDERNAYWRNARAQTRIDPTGQYGSPNLFGSDDLSFLKEDISNNQLNRVAKQSTKTFLKRNKESIIKWTITGLLVPALFFGIKWFFNANADIKVIQYRIDELQAKIENIEDNMTTKEVLDLRLEAIKKDMTLLIPDVSSINARLDALESTVDEMNNGIESSADS